MTDESQRLCNGLLNTDYALSQGCSFANETFRGYLQRVDTRNETLVVRDTTPAFCSFAELLDLDNEPVLEHVTESMDADCKKCSRETIVSAPHPHRLGQSLNLSDRDPTVRHRRACASLSSRGPIPGVGSRDPVESAPRRQRSWSPLISAMEIKSCRVCA